MNNIIPYLAIFIIFTLTLISKISTDPSLREKLSLAGILSLLAVCVYLFYFQIDNIPYMSGAHLFSYSMILPEVIARIINVRQIKSKSVQIKTPILNSVFGFLGTGVFLLITLVIIYLLFIELTSPKSEAVFDAKYFLIRLNFLLVVVSFTVWVYLLATQKTSFYQDGILHNGEVWRWSDFEFYSWRKRTFENDVKELRLTPAKHAWRPGQITLKIPSENQKKIEVLLEKNLKKQ